MHINEGMIVIAPEDKKLLSKYLNDMNKYVNKVLDDISIRDNNKFITCKEMKKLIQSYSDKISTPFPFLIEYIIDFKNKLSAASFNHHYNTIRINLAYSMEYSHTSIGSLCNNIDFKKIGITFIHEFIHYIQFILRYEKEGDYNISNDWNNKSKYWKRPWEQQAWAATYLEKLKQELKIKKPEKMLSQLRKMGVLHDNDLNKLKTSDYKSWKAIMKNAIALAMADVEEGKPLPWQKGKLS